MSAPSKKSTNSFGEPEEASNGNSALDWEIFDILCKDELGLNFEVSFKFVSSGIVQKSTLIKVYSIETKNWRKL